MIGKEYMDFFVDQAEQFTEKELNIMHSCCRWTGVPDRHCKFILTFNPGGLGHGFLKRIFFDRRYQGNEREEDYAFLQSYGWDNVEWAKPQLAQDGLTEADYFDWDKLDEREGKPVGDRRFNYFIEDRKSGAEGKLLDCRLEESCGWEDDNTL